MKIKLIETDYWDDYYSEYPFKSNEELTLETDNWDYSVVLLVEGPKITIAQGNLATGRDFDFDEVKRKIVKGDERYPWPYHQPFFQAEFHNNLEAIAFVTKMPSEFTYEWLIQKGFIDLNDIDEEVTVVKANDTMRKWFTWQKNLIYLIVLFIVLLSLWVGFKFFDPNDLKDSIFGFFAPVGVLFMFWLVGGQLYVILKPLLKWLDKKVFIPLWNR